MPPRETGKQRAARIPLDYFKHPDRIARWKLRLTLLAALAAVAWWATGLALGGRFGLVSSGRGRLRYSHGPLARVHATWEAQCEACHVPFRRIDAKAGDAKCQSCHAGPPHHGNQVAAQVPACAGCHRDHQGRDASLVRLPDKDCTRCHGDLARHVAPAVGEGPRYASVRAFIRDHPEFRVGQGPGGSDRAEVAKAADPGRLKFNHALHLTPGLRKGKDDRPTFTFAQLAEADRDRFGRAPGRPLDDPVALDCGSCHRLDGGDFAAAEFPGLPASLLPARAEGAYMLPIVYENQCAACHALNAPGLSPDGPPLPVRHRQQVDELEASLKEGYLARYLAGEDRGAPGLDQSRRRVPGRRSDEEEAVGRYLGEKVARAGRFLLGPGKNRCTECHFYRDREGREVPGSDGRAAPSALRIEPTGVKSVWFEHAKFDHSSHRALGCRECHAKADASTTQADVLLPGIESCRKCHAPATHSGGVVLGGAGHDCTECHRYHAGPPPGGLARGLGARARDARAEMDLRRFLDGAGGDIHK